MTCVLPKKIFSFFLEVLYLKRNVRKCHPGFNWTERTAAVFTKCVHATVLCVRWAVISRRRSMSVYGSNSLMFNDTSIHVTTEQSLVPYKRHRFPRSLYCQHMVRLPEIYICKEQRAWRTCGPQIAFHSTETLYAFLLCAFQLMSLRTRNLIMYIYTYNVRIKKYSDAFA